MFSFIIIIITIIIIIITVIITIIIIIPINLASLDKSQSSESLASPDHAHAVKLRGKRRLGGTLRHKRSSSEGALARLSLKSAGSWR